jgi:hypothetical protein
LALLDRIESIKAADHRKMSAPFADILRAILVKLEQRDLPQKKDTLKRDSQRVREFVAEVLDKYERARAVDKREVINKNVWDFNSSLFPALVEYTKNALESSATDRSKAFQALLHSTVLSRCANQSRSTEALQASLKEHEFIEAQRIVTDLHERYKRADSAIQSVTLLTDITELDYDLTPALLKYSKWCAVFPGVVDDQPFYTLLQELLQSRITFIQMYVGPIQEDCEIQQPLQSRFSCIPPPPPINMGATPAPKRQKIETPVNVTDTSVNFPSDEFVVMKRTQAGGTGVYDLIDIARETCHPMEFDGKLTVTQVEDKIKVAAAGLWDYVHKPLANFGWFTNKMQRLNPKELPTQLAALATFKADTSLDTTTKHCIHLLVTIVRDMMASPPVTKDE